MKTSGLGWRIVAVGVLFLVFGTAAIANNVGPGWFGIGLCLIGAIIMVVGRQM